MVIVFALLIWHFNNQSNKQPNFVPLYDKNLIYFKDFSKVDYERH